MKPTYPKLVQAARPCAQGPGKQVPCSRSRDGPAQKEPQQQGGWETVPWCGPCRDEGLSKQTRRDPRRGEHGQTPAGLAPGISLSALSWFATMLQVCSPSWKPTKLFTYNLYTFLQSPYTSTTGLKIMLLFRFSLVWYLVGS